MMEIRARRRWLLAFGKGWWDGLRENLMTSIRYRTGKERLDLDEVIGLYRASGLGERRPVDSRATMGAMLEHADVVVTAWEGAELVGIARTLTDFAYVAYLADLAVHARLQRRGIGRELVRRTRAALQPSCFVILLAAPAAHDYYAKLGFEPHPRAWTLPARRELRGGIGGEPAR